MVDRKSQACALGVAALLALAVAPATIGASGQSDSEQYCEQKGGHVVAIKPYLYPDTDNQVELAGGMNVCQFITQEGDNVVQNVVDLNTLYSEKPTLAGLAYSSGVPSSNSGPAGSNPASSYCPDDLGGTETFGTAATGAWVGDFDPGMEAGDAQPLSDTINLCVFADRSLIDDFSLFYRSSGTARGVDLTTVMRYQLNQDSPAIFSSGGA